MAECRFCQTETENRFFCSRECMKVWYAMNHYDAHKRRNAKCVICGTIYYKKHPTHQTCSAKCSFALKAQRGKQPLLPILEALVKRK